MGSKFETVYAGSGKKFRNLIFNTINHGPKFLPAFVTIMWSSAANPDLKNLIRNFKFRPLNTVPVLLKTVIKKLTHFYAKSKAYLLLIVRGLGLLKVSVFYFNFPCSFSDQNETLIRFHIIDVQGLGTALVSPLQTSVSGPYSIESGSSQNSHSGS